MVQLSLMVLNISLNIEMVFILVWVLRRLSSRARILLSQLSSTLTQHQPTVFIDPEKDIKDEFKLQLGSVEGCNKRLNRKYILPGQVETCQLEMGITTLEPGSVWNTMPCHTHDRRMEVYFYFEIPEEDIVVHYMGEPTETRHIIMRSEEAVISPSWSIHSASATHAYAFIWGMAGENQNFDDMDWVDMKDLK